MLMRLAQLIAFLSIAEPGSLIPGVENYRPFLVLMALTAFLWLFSGKNVSGSGIRGVKTILALVLILAFSEIFPAVLQLNLSLFSENLVTWFKLVAMFFLMFSIVQSQRDVRKIFNAVILAVVIHLCVATHILLTSPETLMDGRLATYGMYLGANDYGLLLTCSLPIFLKTAEYSNRWLIKGTLYAFAALIVYQVFLTGSRGSMIGTTVVLALAFWMRMDSQKAVRVALVVLSLAVMAIVGGQKLQELRPDEGERQASSETRLDAWAGCGRMVLWNPLGVGFEQAREYIRDYGMDISIPPHNTYVKIAAEAGIIGFIAYVGILYLIINRLMKIEYFYRVIAHGKKVIPIQALLCMMTGFMINTSLSQKEYDWLLYIALACSARIINLEWEVAVGDRYRRKTGSAHRHYGDAHPVARVLPKKTLAFPL
jgi:O-antigen ligase